MTKVTNEFNEFVLFSEVENNALDSRAEVRDVRGKQSLASTAPTYTPHACKLIALAPKYSTRMFR